MVIRWWWKVVSVCFGFGEFKYFKFIMCIDRDLVFILKSICVEYLCGVNVVNLY